MSTRRDFITLLGGAAAAARPIGARAQQPTIPVIGFLNSESPDLFAYLVLAFRQGLSQSGYVEGSNVAIEYRWAHGQYDRLPALVADLIRREVIVIAAKVVLAPVMAAKAATTTIPVVFATGYDPVAAGLVASLARPGSNLTGVNVVDRRSGAEASWSCLYELVPTATSIALLVNPAARFPPRDNIDRPEGGGTQTEAAIPGPVRQHRTRLRCGLCISGPVAGERACDRQRSFLQQPKQTTGRAGHPPCCARHLSVSRVRYGRWLDELRRNVYGHVSSGRRPDQPDPQGEKPADLPVRQSTKVELIVNLKTAKALGLTVPPTLLARADEVIE